MLMWTYDIWIALLQNLNYSINSYVFTIIRQKSVFTFFLVYKANKTITYKHRLNVSINKKI